MEPGYRHDESRIVAVATTKSKEVVMQGIMDSAVVTNALLFIIAITLIYQSVRKSE